MSDVQTGFGAVGVKFLASRFSATGRIRRDLVAPLVTGLDAAVVYPSFNPLLARREASGAQLTHHARTTVDPAEFGMNGADQGQHLAVGQALAIRLAASRPRPITADADVKDIAHFGQRKPLALNHNPDVLHRTPFAKYAVAFLRFRSPA